MGEDASRPSLNVQSAELREVIHGLIAEELAAQRERQAQIADIMVTAGQPQAPLKPPRPRRPKRDRHGMHIVRGLGLAATGAAAAVRHHRTASRFLATAVLVAAGTASTVSPDMLEPAPAASVPLHRHMMPIAHHRRRDTPAPMPTALPPRRRRRHGAADDDDAAPVPAARRPAPSPVPSPTVTPEPDPSPSPSPDPDPTPSPTCKHPGKSCHAGDEVVVAQRAPPGLTELPWPPMAGALRTLVP